MGPRTPRRPVRRRARKADRLAAEAERPLEETLRRLAADLEVIEAPWALVGGLAVSARSRPRTTEDVDVAVKVGDDSQAERALSALRAGGFEIRMVIEQTRVGRLSTARLTRRGAPTYVDLLFASSGIETELVEAAEQIAVLPGLVLPVARIGHLLAMKMLARDDKERPLDRVDIRNLLAVATPEDLATAKEALGLIERRGFARGRRLLRRWEATLRELGSPSAPRKKRR